jgi:hypothetical protein
MLAPYLLGPQSNSCLPVALGSSMAIIIFYNCMAHVKNSDLIASAILPIHVISCCACILEEDLQLQAQDQPSCNLFKITEDQFKSVKFIRSISFPTKP